MCVCVCLCVCVCVCVCVYIYIYILAGTAKAVAKGGSKLVGAAAGAARRRCP